jgi:hypothetical protein
VLLGAGDHLLELAELANIIDQFLQVGCLHMLLLLLPQLADVPLDIVQLVLEMSSFCYLLQSFLEVPGVHSLNVSLFFFMSLDFQVDGLLAVWQLYLVGKNFGLLLLLAELF